MLSGPDYIFISLAGMGAGFVNAIAGGGTLITFPALTAVGVPLVAANVTNAIALCPGFLGAALAQRRDLVGQERRMWILMPVSALGAVFGALLLLKGGDRIFRNLIPFLILGAAALLAAQERIRTWLVSRTWHRASGRASETRLAALVGLGSIYGGYFGAGLSVIMLAVLGLLIDESLTRINALKSTLGLAINVAAAVCFVFSGQIIWPAAVVVAGGAVIGGVAGGRLAGRIRQGTLRWTVVSIGTVVGLIYLVR